MPVIPDIVSTSAIDWDCPDWDYLHSLICLVSDLHKHDFHASIKCDK